MGRWPVRSAVLNGVFKSSNGFVQGRCGEDECGKVNVLESSEVAVGRRCREGEYGRMNDVAGWISMRRGSRELLDVTDADVEVDVDVRNA